jgi:hypothetical protein
LVSSVTDRLLWFSIVKYRLSTSGYVAQLTAGCVSLTGTLDLDDIGAEPGQQLRAGRARTVHE